jgi:multidrug resistance efflux pump
MYLLGLMLVVAMLVGARALSGNGHAADGQKTASPAPKAQNNRLGGLTVLGTVDSDPSPIRYGLSPLLQSGTISRVWVKDGQEVRKGDLAKGILGDKLYEFDSAIQRHDLEQAKLKVQEAKNELAKANEAKKQHEKKIKAMEKAVEDAKTKVTVAQRLYELIKSNLERGYKANNIDPALWPQRAADDPELFKAHASWIDARSASERLEEQFDMLKTADIDLVVKQAQIGIDQAQALQDKAQTAVDKCTIWAQQDGTIEQVKISEGTTLGVGTRDPALWLVPGGARIVRAEGEAEFAHRVTPDLIGKEVVIKDHTDQSLTYRGKVVRIGETFMPKHSPEGVLGNDTRVLPVQVEVLGAAPADKPPLRVGQRVRVQLGQ